MSDVIVKFCWEDSYYIDALPTFLPCWCYSDALSDIEYGKIEVSKYPVEGTVRFVPVDRPK